MPLLQPEEFTRSVFVVIAGDLRPA